jgi:hypothetical protein
MPRKRSIIKKTKPRSLLKKWSWFFLGAKVALVCSLKS